MSRPGPSGPRRSRERVPHRPVINLAPAGRFRDTAAGLFGSWFAPGGLRGLALTALGFVAGVAVGVALLSARLDTVSLEREQLTVKKADLEIQAERLREELDKARSQWLAAPVVTQVNLNLEGLDELTRVRVQAEVIGILDDLVGRQVPELDPALAFHLLDGRVVTIEGNRIGLTVKAVVLGPQTEFWVELKALPAKESATGG